MGGILVDMSNNSSLFKEESQPKNDFFNQNLQKKDHKPDVLVSNFNQNKANFGPVLDSLVPINEIANNEPKSIDSKKRSNHSVN